MSFNEIADSPKDPNKIETNGYAECRGCGNPVIGEILCCYCNEARVALGMGEIADLTQDQLDTLCVMSDVHYERDGG